MKLAADKRVWLVTVVLPMIVLGLIVRSSIADRTLTPSPSTKTLEQLPSVI
jgi:hypothetical protein